MSERKSETDKEDPINRLVKRLIPESQSWKWYTASLVMIAGGLMGIILDSADGNFGTISEAGGLLIGAGIALKVLVDWTRRN